MEVQDTFAIVFDVDGVLIRGSTAIPKAKDSLSLVCENK